MNSWHVYILRCCDGTLYTGITNDLDKRVKAHNEGHGARYDHAHIIQYTEDRERGTVHVDGEDDYETGLTLHVRGFDLTDGKSKYGKLAKR